MIEPASVAPLGVARDALELEAEPADDVERRLVLRRRRHAHAMEADGAEGEVEARARGLGHVPALGVLAPQPVTELARAMHLDASLEAHHPIQIGATARPDHEAQGAA